MRFRVWTNAALISAVSLASAVPVSLANTSPQFLKKHPASPKNEQPRSDEGDFSAGQDAVTHTAVRNQGHVGFCWAYTLAAFMEGEAKKNGINVIISPEYLGFYHMYFQLQKHLAQFDSVARGLKQGDVDDAVNEAFQRVYVQNRFFTPSEGSDEKIALQELQISGAVPQQAFNFKLGSGPKETDFENSIKSFIKSNMFSGKALETYRNTDADGINEALFESLSKALKIRPPKPSDRFSFQGKSLTPRSFVTDYLGFDSSGYVELPVPRGAEQGALNAIRELMKKNIAVPIGFEIFDDADPGSETNAQFQAEEAGDFSTRFCPRNECKAPAGGHEVLGVNWTEDSSGNVTAIIVKNSWGHRGGRNDRGQKTHDTADSGFYVLEAAYLSQSNPWLFIAPRNLVGSLR